VRPLSRWHLNEAARTVRGGGILAYPTEAVYGLGCDPGNAEAVLKLLAIKQRPLESGLILIASDMAQLRPFIEPLGSTMLGRVEATWPGPVTWLVPARPETPIWLRGRHHSIAVRLTAHPLAAALCAALGQALVSTSANRHGRPPARNALQVRKRLGDSIDLLICGATGPQARPTEIRDARSGRVVRPA
jgi:L-threonylcarbamoyladenylate synthase